MAKGKAFKSLIYKTPTRGSSKGKRSMGNRRSNKRR